jgi:TolB-like protein
MVVRRFAHSEALLSCQTRLGYHHQHHRSRCDDGEDWAERSTQYGHRRRCCFSSERRVGRTEASRAMAMIFAFGPFRLDAKAETLFRDTEPVALSKRAVALLRILVEPAGALVSKDVLIEAAWPGLAIEESNLTVQIAALRRALGEVPGGEDWIVTLPRRGYRFVGPVVTKSEAQVSAAPIAEPAAMLSPTTALALPDKPSIAVLPFENLSGDPEQGYFADGMAEEIITALSRIRWLFVIARNSSFTYKGQVVDVRQVGKELGIMYVLEGSVRRAGNRIRITGQLLSSAHHLSLRARES